VILAIETSCDETCAAVVDGRTVRASVVASQTSLHARYGGVVPEVASRRHLEALRPVVREALDEAGATLGDCGAVAVTTGPGLIGALLVGVAAAKAYAYAAGRPLVPVDHLHGHIASLLLADDPPEPPFLCLLASGGHTLFAAVDDWASYRVLGSTLDDAAGEAFDKGARLLGLGYPGGAAIDRLAAEGDAERFAFPVAMERRPGLDLSFSGLKTALALKVRELGPEATAAARADLCASYQRALVASLVARTRQALAATGATALGVVGGVAANAGLRAALAALADESGVRTHLAPLRFCGDNAAMIGAAAAHVRPLAYPSYLAVDAHARADLGVQS
jgi:N6-L-threonylcarbamoyladenine synthase